MKQKILHYPNLKTVIMVENVLRDAELAISKEELKRRLSVGIMHQTLNVILKYLEDRGMVVEGPKGVLWSYNESPKLKKAIERGIEV